ncbi:MAG: TorF family putative porin [Bdellovibrionia bacterium]
MKQHSAISRFRFLILSFIFIAFTFETWAQSSGNSSDGGGQTPTFHMTGDAHLLSNFVRRGLTQTTQDPALQGSFWFNFGPQFRLGLWGSNVRYKGESAHLNLQLAGDIKVTFSANSSLSLRFADEQYFDAEQRKGTITGLILQTFDLKTTFESLSNWEGTGDSASYYNFLYKFKLGSTWELDAKLGYVDVKSDDYNSFIEGGADLIYVGQQIQGILGLNYATENYFSRGGTQFFVGARTSF